MRASITRASSRTARECDAQNRATEHKRVETVAGAYWLCAECGQIFTTVETPVLYADGSPVPLSALDGEIRWRNVEAMRLRRGYHGGIGGRKPFERGAQLRVRVTVVDPARERAA